MQTVELEQALQHFERIATHLGEQGPFQLWRFEYEAKRYDLYFYPRQFTSAATAHHDRLTALAEAQVAAPRERAYLPEFRINNDLGTAIVADSSEGAVPLDQYLREHWISGEVISDRPHIVEQVAEIINGIGRSGFTHDSLRLSSFLISRGDQTVYLGDVAHLRDGQFLNDDLMLLASDASKFASRAELLRGWKLINPDYSPPRKNKLAGMLQRRLVQRSQAENEDFGVLRLKEWSGYFTKSSAPAVPWSHASQLGASQRDWEQAWPILLAQIESDQLTIIKRDASGDVLKGEVILGGRPIQVIVKRPRRKVLYRYLIDLFRPARAERMWIKAWMMIARNLPTEWPMLLMQRKVLGYASDGIIVFEKVPGTSLDKIDLNQMEPKRRDMLFRRAGRILRQIENSGLVHYDSKSTNWIVYQSDAHGAIPVMIDMDGIRPLNYWLQLWGLHRLLRAMKQHPQYTPADSLALCQGFAPSVKVHREDEPAKSK